MAGKTSPGFKITGLDKIADPNPVPENAPKLTSPLLSESDVIKAAMSGQAQIIGGENPGFVDAATIPESSGGSSLLGGVDNFVSNVGGQVTEAVKPVADKITPNLKQDPIAPVNQALQDINVPRPNTEQDLTKVSVQGLQESLVEQGTQLQQEAINTGTKIQETVVQAGSNLQEAAVQAGSSISGGQSNPTLENAAEQVTTYVEDKVVPVVRDLYAIAYGDQNPQLKFAQAVVHDLEKNTKGLEALGNLDASLNASDDAYSSTTTPMADLDAKDYTGNEDPFGNIETATTKADKLTEEERLRRIRRLMLNRYGREDTILTGAKDPFNRRRYARSL